MNKYSILLVEDDPNLGMVLQEYMELKNYSVTLCTDGDMGLAEFQSGRFDLCILDVMMPKQDGFTLAQNIRKHDADVPVIFLTAKSMKEDKIEGFKLGADDYITKPFSIEELFLRIQAIMRRYQAGAHMPKEQKTFSIGKYSFDYEQRILRSDDFQQHLTWKEAELLRMLCLNENNVLRREHALKAIWGDDSYFNGRSMDVYITKLRKYLKSDADVEIMNVHGTGFRLAVPSKVVA